jgi:hypothetical protein
MTKEQQEALIRDVLDALRSVDARMRNPTILDYQETAQHIVNAYSKDILVIVKVTEPKPRSRRPKITSVQLRIRKGSPFEMLP